MLGHYRCQIGIADTSLNLTRIGLERKSVVLNITSCCVAEEAKTNVNLSEKLGNFGKAKADISPESFFRPFSMGL